MERFAMSRADVARTLAITEADVSRALAIDETEPEGRARGGLLGHGLVVSQVD